MRKVSSCLFVEDGNLEYVLYGNIGEMPVLAQKNCKSGIFVD